tara:strand:+ start:1384 stop:1953 length:570 start_codon:yes stop_codon:yes gene_type:complete
MPEENNEPVENQEEVDAQKAAEEEAARVAAEEEAARVVAEEEAARVAAEEEAARVAAEEEAVKQEAAKEEEKPKQIDGDRVIQYLEVLSKWSTGKVRRFAIPEMLSSLSNETNNLDMVENIVATYKDFLNENISFLNNDKFSKVTPSKSELSDDKKKEVLEKLMNVTLSQSKRDKPFEELRNIVNDIYS